MTGPSFPRHKCVELLFLLKAAKSGLYKDLNDQPHRLNFFVTNNLEQLIEQRVIDEGYLQILEGISAMGYFSSFFAKRGEHSRNYYEYD